MNTKEKDIAQTQAEETWDTVTDFAWDVMIIGTVGLVVGWMIADTVNYYRAAGNPLA